jgi:two-component system chemotaxis response regulator CheY
VETGPVPSSILVVDDDPNMRELLRIHLSNAGYEVNVAGDGLEAGYGVLRNRPDLIISDVNMPHLNGFEFIAAIRAEAVFRSIPVIFLTSAAEGEQRGRELGAVGYVAKPVHADKLLSLVAAHVRGGRVPIG